jgi:hypothetical protein
VLRFRRLSGLLSKRDAGEDEGKEEEIQGFHKDGRIITGWRNILRHGRGVRPEKFYKFSRIDSLLTFDLSSLLNIIVLR